MKLYSPDIALGADQRRITARGAIKRLLHTVLLRFLSWPVYIRLAGFFSMYLLVFFLLPSVLDQEELPPISYFSPLVCYSLSLRLFNWPNTTRAACGPCARTRGRDRIPGGWPPLEQAQTLRRKRVTVTDSVAYEDCMPPIVDSTSRLGRSGNTSKEMSIRVRDDAQVYRISSERTLSRISESASGTFS